MGTTRRLMLRSGLAAVAAATITPALLAACDSAPHRLANRAVLQPVATPASPPVPAPTPNGRVLAHGDSITFGVGASTATRGYAYQVVMGLRARHLGMAESYLLHGVPSGTTADLLSDMADMHSVECADLVIVELGTNDAWSSATLDGFRAQYTRLLTQLRQQSPSAQLVGLTCWRDPKQTTPSGKLVSAFNTVIAQTLSTQAASGPTHTIDLGPLFLTAGYHSTTGDTFHPNDAGHAAIAQAILACA